MQTLHTPPASVKISYPTNRIKNEEYINGNKVACSGTDENSTHPNVYISLKQNISKCHYCGIIFKK